MRVIRMVSKSYILDPETQEWVEEEEYRQRRRIRKELEKLLESYVIEMEIDLKTGKARGRLVKVK